MFELNFSVNTISIDLSIKPVNKFKYVRLGVVQI